MLLSNFLTKLQLKLHSLLHRLTRSASLPSSFEEISQRPEQLQQLFAVLAFVNHLQNLEESWLSWLAGAGLSGSATAAGCQ